MIGAYLQNRYRLDAELDQGGMGTIYRATDTLLQREVAVKVLSASGLGTAGRARLLREAQAVARLNHPNIVSLYDAGEASGTPFIVMELVAGQTLRQKPPQSIEETLQITRQLCDALDHAHKNGVVHRDLKPENVLITPEGIAKLVDFGLAHSDTTHASVEGALVGTVFYLAPEQALGQEIDARTDLYALGVMLYELTASRLPFNADDPLAVISQHLYAPVTPPSTFNAGIPPALDALTVQLLSKRPEDRPTSASEVRRRLDGLEQPSTAAPAHRETTELSLLDRIVRGRLVSRQIELGQLQELMDARAAGRSQPSGADLRRAGRGQNPPRARADRVCTVEWRGGAARRLLRIRGRHTLHAVRRSPARLGQRPQRRRTPRAAGIKRLRVVAPGAGD